MSLWITFNQTCIKLISVMIVKAVKACLNGFVHETDKKLHCLCIPCGLQITLIHSVMDLRK